MMGLVGDANLTRDIEKLPFFLNELVARAEFPGVKCGFMQL
jgi:hypothetical protein